MVLRFHRGLKILFNMQKETMYAVPQPSTSAAQAEPCTLG